MKMRILLAALHLGLLSNSLLFADEPKADKPAEPPPPEVFSPPEFEVPPGFTVEVAAAPPLVKHPIMAGFDDKGRLYVAENAGMNLPRVDLEKQLPNGILRLEDSDGDGKFDTRTVFADRMTFPQGALWHDGSLYVASSGAIWKLTDHNDDGVADERQLLVSKFGYTGNAADVHGCFLGPDGRIYWCEGRHGHEITDTAGNLISKGKAARIFSCKTDGSDVQVHCGGGMDNPVEIDWTEEGEMLGTVNIFYHKRGDCLVHWMRGGVYPRLDQPAMLDEFPRTGEPLDAVHDFGHVAVSGCMRYRSSLPLPLGEGRGEGVSPPGEGKDPHPNPLPRGEGTKQALPNGEWIGFGPEYANNWFVTEFNTHKVKRCILEREGSTFKATVHEFLKAKSDDFHPTDVLEDADGSLLVVDTGGWFRIGCPQSQVAKSHILGGIYRVRKTDAKKVADPRGLAKDWNKVIDADLIKYLDDPRYVVRKRVTAEIARHRARMAQNLADPLLTPRQRFISGLEAAIQSDSPKIRARFTPVIEGNFQPYQELRTYQDQYRTIKGDDGKAFKIKSASRLVEKLLANTEKSERNNSWEFKSRLLSIYGASQLENERMANTISAVLEFSTSPPLLRESATSLGRMRSKVGIPAILDRLAQPNDRVLEHALIYALIEINSREETAKGLAHENPAVRRGALIALDQMRDGNLTRDEVVALLDSDDVPLQSAAMEIVTRRKWTDDLIAFAGKLLEQPELKNGQRKIVCSSLTSLAKDAKVQSLLSTTLAKETLPAPQRKLLLETIADADLPELPAELVEVIKASLASPVQEVAHAAVLAAKAEALAEPLLAIARETNRPAETRLAALAAVASHKKPLGEADVSFLKGLVTQGETPLERITAARALGSAALTADQLKVIAALIAEVGPLEMSPLLSAFAGTTDDAVGKELAASLAKSPGGSSLSLTQLEALLAPYSPQAREAAQPLMEKLASAAKEQRQRIEELLVSIEGGNPAAGRDVFLTRRAACTACHRVGPDGGKIGPDLSKVGERRSQRDLLEAVLYPSASVGQGFETYLIQTTGGQTVTGLVTRRTADSIFLRTTDQKDIRLHTAEIELMKPSPVSIMPAGLENTMTPEQLRDLIAYLRSLK